MTKCWSVRLYLSVSGDYYDDPNYDYDGSAASGGDDYGDYDDYDDEVSDGDGEESYITEEELDYFPEMITRPQKVVADEGTSATLPCEANVRQ